MRFCGFSGSVSSRRVALSCARSTPLFADGEKRGEANALRAMAQRIVRPVIETKGKGNTSVPQAYVVMTLNIYFEARRKKDGFSL